MTTYKHIVQVHPVENGEVNLSKVRYQHEFHFESSARKWADGMNRTESEDGEPEYQAVYFGRVNDITGELE
jgi:hypothetical protein